MTGTVLTVADLRVTFTLPDREVHAVNGVSFELAAGEVLGLVGESGSGKSAVLRALIGLLPSATTTVAGSVRYDGHELVGARDRVLRGIRGADISMVFQDPMTFLNPVLKIGEQIGEALQRHTELGRRERRLRTIELLELVGINAPHVRIRQHPHQLSGGMRQRVVIAIALACGPRVLLADEPTTALDVSVQGQILRLLADLRERLGMSMILVSHDLGVIAQSCDRVAVMYGGQLVEVGPVAEVVARPRHPYTVGLLRSLPGHGAGGRYLKSIAGSPPSLEQAPATCTFLPRCELAADGCRTWPTGLLDAGPERVARCVRHEEVPRV